MLDRRAFLSGAGATAGVALAKPTFGKELLVEGGVRTTKMYLTIDNSYCDGPQTSSMAIALNEQSKLIDIAFAVSIFYGRTWAPPSAIPELDLPPINFPDREGLHVYGRAVILKQKHSPIALVATFTWQGTGDDIVQSQAPHRRNCGGLHNKSLGPINVGLLIPAGCPTPGTTNSFRDTNGPWAASILELNVTPAKFDYSLPEPGYTVQPIFVTNDSDFADKAVRIRGNVST